MPKTLAIFLPPLPSMSGGFHMLLHLGESMAQLGHDVFFVIHEQGPPLPIYQALRQKTKLPLRSWHEAHLTSKHVWIIPEGWPNALVLGLRSGARCIVYMQSWSFAMRTLPPGVHWQQLPVDFLYVSEPTRHCLRELTGKDGPILRPCVHTELFYPPALAPAAAHFDGPLRIAWMPRKNKGLGLQIVDAFTQRNTHLPQPWCAQKPVQWMEIHKVPYEKVPEALRACHIFLTTGFPEGFGLPALEAMACGCIPVGFSGLGGWDYMRSHPLPASSHPFVSKAFFPMPPCPVDGIFPHGGGNGFFVEDAHVLAAILALEHAAHLLYEGGEELNRLRQNMALTANAYSWPHYMNQLQKLEPFFMA